MPFMKSKKKRAQEHVIKNVFGLGDDHNIFKALKEDNIDTIMDLIVLRIEDLKLYAFTDDQGNQ
jgi:hypothetical protein